MIQGHIKNLLYTYDCVIIPEFGGLITHYTSAKIHPVKHTFTPPSKRIAFNEQLNVSDGLLTSTLAKQQQWPLQQAQQAVAEFVQELKEQLLHQHRFELSDIGVFRYNAERKLVFENIESENFLDASFGLPELVSKPILGRESLVLRGKYKDQTIAPEQENKKVVGRFRRLYRIGASLVLGGVAVTGIYLISVQNDVALSSLNPFTLLVSPSENTSQATVEVDQKTEALYPTYSESETDVLEEQLTLADETTSDDSFSESFTENSPETADAWNEPAALETPAVEPAKASAPAAVAAKPVVKKEATAAPIVTKPVVAEAKNEASTLITQKTGRYYVIMGVFTQDGYAERNLKQLEKKGFNAKIITPASDRKMRERVSVADFATAQEAHAALPALRNKINNEIWVFNF